MRDTRLKRYDDFKYLFDNRTKIFTKLAKQNSSHEYFDKYYKFNVIPCDEKESNTKSITIFYGSKPFDMIKDSPRKSIKLLAEHGATLLFERHDNGFVSILYYPSTSENLRQKEDLIVYKYVRKTKK